MVLLLVVGLGLLIVSLQGRARKAVPRAADRLATDRDRVVGTGESGQPVTESQLAGEAQPRNASAFEEVLKDELDELQR